MSMITLLEQRVERLDEYLKLVVTEIAAIRKEITQFQIMKNAYTSWDVVEVNELFERCRFLIEDVAKKCSKEQKEVRRKLSQYLSGFNCRGGA